MPVLSQFIVMWFVGLPALHDYHVCNYKKLSETHDHVNFRATLRMALSTVDEIKLWLKSHKVAWMVDWTIPGKGWKVIFKLRCLVRCMNILQSYRSILSDDVVVFFKKNNKNWVRAHGPITPAEAVVKKIKDNLSKIIVAHCSYLWLPHRQRLSIY